MVLLGLGFHRRYKLSGHCFWQGDLLQPSIYHVFSLKKEVRSVFWWQCNELEEIWVRANPFVGGLGLGCFSR